LVIAPKYADGFFVVADQPRARHGGSRSQQFGNLDLVGRGRRLAHQVSRDFPLVLDVHARGLGAKRDDVMRKRNGWAAGFAQSLRQCGTGARLRTFGCGDDGLSSEYDIAGSAEDVEQISVRREPGKCRTASRSGLLA
jgi:hypothetical protein